MRQTKLIHHVRTAAEQTLPGYIVARKFKMSFGIPSVEIIAAVANDRIIMWREVPGPWCGQAAADMYADLGSVLRKRYPGSSSLRVAEDGDTKGFQSNAGKQAKSEQALWLGSLLCGTRASPNVSYRVTPPLVVNPVIRDRGVTQCLI